jgi:hypothetical protein
VGRYFRDNLQDPDLTVKLHAQLTFMADRIYYDAYVHIVVFYLYFTKDTQIIERILRNAEAIYKEHEPATLEAKCPVGGSIRERNLESIGRLVAD